MTGFMLLEMGAHPADQQHEKWAAERPGGRMDQSVLNKHGENHIIGEKKYGPWQDLW